MKIFKKAFAIIDWAFTLFVILWLATSFNEIIQNNSSVAPTYSPYNAFVMFDTLLEETFCS